MMLRGKENPAIMELSDTYLNITRNSTKVRTQSIAACECTARIIPNKVATPFPPLKPTKIGNKCPKTAVTPSASW